MTSDETPSVTIAITAFNSEHTLRRAVKSALEQDYPNTNVLIVDDRSTDRTYAVATELARCYEKIKVIRARKNGGVATSRNLIIQNTNADFIAFFDDDDVSLPSRISEQIDHIKYCESGNDQKLVICHTARIVHYSEVHSRYEKALAQDAGPSGMTGSIVSDAILCGTNNRKLRGACPTCSQMARLTTYHKLNGFDESLLRSEDTDFSIRAAERGATFVGVKKPLVHQIMTNGSDKNLKLETQNWLYLLGKHRPIIERKMNFRFAIAWLELRHEWLEKNHVSFLSRLFILMIAFPLPTLRKAYLALPNLRLHAAMSKFAKNSER